MKDELKELISIAKSLPAEKAAEVVDFARFLSRQPKARRRRTKSSVLGDAKDEAEWRRILNDPRPRPKLAAWVRETERLEREGKTEPLDLSRFDV